MKRAIQLVGIFLIFSSFVFAQVDQKLGNFPQSAAKGYIQPLVDVMGANLNSGLYHTASMSKLFGFYVGVKAMAVFIPSSIRRLRSLAIKMLVQLQGIKTFRMFRCREE